MTEVVIRLDSAAAALYAKIGERTGRTLEQVIGDALFRLAGELSLQALKGEYPPL